MRELIEKHVLEQEVKKSRFIAAAFPVKTPTEALSMVEDASDKDATHNCWAYKIGGQYRFSDDGEPGGTAGRPILAAIEKQEVDRCLVVVTRFFGGIKLGAGGLVRAYGGAAAECLRSAPQREIRSFITLTFIAPFDCIGEVYGLMKNHLADKNDEQFEQQGVRLVVTLEETSAIAFEKTLIGATRGRAELISRTVM
jgi:uncharacterized YigZ family protein